MERGEGICSHNQVLAGRPPTLEKQSLSEGKKDSSVERSLATIHEAHQKVLAAVAALKGEIKRLSCTQTCPEVRARSKSKDHQEHSRVEQKKRHHQVQFEEHPAPNCPLA